MNIEELNEQQKKAVTHTDGPCIIVAGAGTGKTKVLTSRIAYLIHEKIAKPEEILALTFTDKAAAEMEERVDIMMPLSYSEICIKTFHSFCDGILREKGIDIGIDPGYTMLSESDILVFMKKNLFDFSLDYYRPLGNPTKFILTLVNYFSKLKDEDISPVKYAQWVIDQERKFEEIVKDGNIALEEKQILELEIQKQRELATVYHEYQAKMLSKNQFDFGDLIYYTNKLLFERPNVRAYYQDTFKYILVDEFQDTNFAQNKLLSLLADKHQNIMVVGDDDQAIYKFRGASVKNILQFQKKYQNSKHIVLTQNYRSHQDILDFSYESIQKNNPERLEAIYQIKKELTSKYVHSLHENHTTLVEVHSPQLEREVEYVVSEIEKLKTQYRFSEIAILGRARSHLKPFYEALIKAGYPVKLSNTHNFKDNSIVKDLLSILRIIANPYDNTSWFRVLKMNEWGFSMEEVLQLIEESRREYAGVWKTIKHSNNKHQQNDTTVGPDHTRPTQDITDHNQSQNNSCNDKQQKIHDFFLHLLSFSKHHTVTEVLYEGILEKLNIFQKLDTLEDKDSSLENIHAISSLLDETKAFEAKQDDPHTKAYIDYLNIVEESRDQLSEGADLNEDQEKILLSTVHGVKGLEYKVVFLVNMTNDRFPARRKADPLTIPETLSREDICDNPGEKHIMEERRLFYVAVTRAKDRLYLSWSDYQKASGKRKSKKSVFLTEVEESDMDIQRIELSQTSKDTNIQKNMTEPANTPTNNQDSDLHKNDNSAEKKPITVSYSQLSCYEICPKKYEFQYEYRLPTPPSAALSFGSTLHNTLNEFYKLVANKQTSMFQEEEEAKVDLETLLKLYHKNWIPNGYKTEGHLVARHKRGEEILREYYDIFKDYFGNPLYLEKGFSLRLGNIIVKGRFDRVDSLDDSGKVVEIFDYKTGKTKDQKAVDNDLQLSIYALAAQENLGKHVEKLSLYFLEENKKVETTRDEKKLEKAKEKITKLAEGIAKKDYTAKPSKIMCGYCDFRNICNDAQL